MTGMGSISTYKSITSSVRREEGDNIWFIVITDYPAVG